MSHLLIVELVGPLVDDRGGAQRTLLEVLSARGLVARDGVADAVAGASADHAVATLLGGHGREHEPAVLAADAAEVERRWLAAVARGDWKVVPGAADAVTRLGPIGVISNLPSDGVAAALAEIPHARADAARGLPHPDAILALARNAGAALGDVTVAVHSPAALLAATQAGAGRIVLVGERHGRWTDMLPVTARVGSLLDLARLVG